MATLVQRVAELRKTMQDGALGPLRVAEEMMKIGAAWETYREEAGGLSFSSWSKRELGVVERYWEERAQAISALGAEIKNNVDHTVAVWIMSSVPVQYRAEVLKWLFLEFRRRRRNPVSKSAAMKHVRAKIMRVASVSRGACAECERLRKELEELRASIGAAAE